MGLKTLTGDLFELLIDLGAVSIIATVVYLVFS